MRKIPTLFVRDPDNMRYVLRDVHPACQWVTEGHGRPTRKMDGTCVLFDGDRWWTRREIKLGKQAPDNYVPLGTDPETGKTVGWEPAEQSAWWKWITEAINREDERDAAFLPGRTYELLGPKVNGNPEGFEHHTLWLHGGPVSPEVRADVATAPRDWDGLRTWLHARPYEGIVWHWLDDAGTKHLAKIKKRDFPSPTTEEDTTR